MLFPPVLLWLYKAQDALHLSALDVSDVRLKDSQGIRSKGQSSQQVSISANSVLLLCSKPLL